MAKYRCGAGHEWESANSPAPARCPRCGSLASVPAESATVNIDPNPASPIPSDGTIDLPPASASPPSDATIDIVPPSPAAAASGQTVDLVPGAAPAADAGGQTVDIAPQPESTGIMGGAWATQQHLGGGGTIDFSPGAPDGGSDRTGAWNQGDATQKLATPGAATGRWGQTEAGSAAKKSGGGKQGPAAIGTRIAGYEILGELGRGGMGVVYKARQVGLNRLVALKMIISGAHAGSTELARFRAEAESIAGLGHPNIVQVYEVGEHEGLPFFSLEFVDGKPMDNLIGGAPQEAKQAAQWFQQLAEGMAAAHKAGIIHRDLKPANVLLTKDGVPKITDFGLAKRFEDGDSGNTRTGSILGTPSYMPPEQAAGKTKETGPPADIYSLGAIFYELLTGRPPFRGASPLETIKQVQKMDPVPPTRLQPSTPRDLETICLKCLEKEPARRYASSAALAEDVRRWLNHEPILARPTPAWEVAWKWSRRNPEKAGILATIVLSVMLLIGVGAWFTRNLAIARDEAERQRDAAQVAQEKEADARRDEERQRQLAESNERQAVQARDEADQQRRQAEEQRERAQVNFQHAQDAVEQMLTRVGSEKLANVPRMEKVRRDLLQRALAFYHKFLAAAGDDVKLRHEAGRAQLRVGDIHEKLGEPEKAEEAYQSAIQVFAKLAEEAPARPEYRRDLAAAYNDLGILLQSTKRYTESDAAYRKSLELKETLVKESNAALETRFELAKSLINQANLLAERAQLPESIADFRKALALLTPLAKEEASPAVLREAARARGSLGVLLINTGKTPDGEASLRESETDFARLAEANPEATEDRLELARTRFNLGTLMQITNRPTDAERYYQDAAVIVRKLTVDFPDVIEYRQLLADCEKHRGVLLRTTNRTKEAEPVWREAVALLNRLSLELPKDASYRQRKAEAQNEYAIALAAAGKTAEAEEQWRDAIRNLEPLAVAQPREPANWRVLLECRSNLCAILAALGKGQDELKARQELLAALEKRLAAVPGDATTLSALGQTQNDLAIAHFEANRLPVAATCLKEAIRWQRQAIAADGKVNDYRTRLAGHCNALFEVLARQGDHAALAAAVTDGVKDLAAGPARVPAAAALARAVPLAQKDPKLAPEQQAAKAGAYAAQAIALLRESLASGFKDIEQLRKSPAFESLRERDEFKKLLESAGPN